MVVALVALGVALGGTAMAASRLVNGDKLIRKASLSGNRLRPATITAKQINFAKLGVVPSAAAAQSAQTAHSALSALEATNANTAAGLAQITYRSTVFEVPANLVRATGTAACPAGSFATGGGVQITGLTLSGDVSYRDDANFDAAIEGNFGTGSFLADLWLRHAKVGMWIDSCISSSCRTFLASNGFLPVKIS